MKRVYIDCEFTKLDADRKLISIGLVASDGQELYVELPENYTVDECSDFTVQHVLPHLQPERYGLSKASAAWRIGDWIEQLHHPVLLASDAPDLDVPMLLELVSSWMPPNILPNSHYVALGNVQQEFEAYFDRPGARRHHALWDARALAHAARIEDEYWLNQSVPIPAGLVQRAQALVEGVVIDINSRLPEEGDDHMAKVLHTATILHAGWDMDNEAKIVELEDGKRVTLTTCHGVECAWTREMAEQKLAETEASAESIRKALEMWPE